MTESSPPALRSVHADGPAYITFVNRTNFPVDILWIDYRGHLVRYTKRLDPGKCMYQNTFETHPWVAWNSDTLECATFSGQFVFYPMRWKGEEYRTVVYIDRPMRRLLDICVQQVRSVVKHEDVEKLEIPKHLFESLKKERKVEFRDYHSQRE